MTAILSSIEIARGRERSPAEYEELLDLVHDECTRLTTLINQLLILAESDAGVLEQVRHPVALDELVQRSVDMFAGVAEERKVCLLAKVEPGITVSGDAGQLRQVLNNLLDNAIKFTPSRGHVTITLCRDRNRREALLSIRDTGAGIARDDLPRIFDRFYQVERSRDRTISTRGSGLGLSICKAIVTAHGGCVEVESLLTLGTTFRVRIPERDGAMEDAAARAGRHCEAGNGRAAGH